MRRVMRTCISAALISLSAVICLTSASAQPAIWETRFGATLPGQVLDDMADGTANLTFGSMSFPFNGIIYTGTDTLNVSSNGFISLGGDNGDGCCNGNPVELVEGEFPRIAPFWIDLDPENQGGDIYFNTFSDDDDAETDRIVITFSSGFNDCLVLSCYVHAQVQLLENGSIIFGYNSLTPTSHVTSDLLVGVSPGGGTTDPGSTDLTPAHSFNTNAVPTVYEYFSPSFPAMGGLQDLNIVFIPNGLGGYIVSNTMIDPPGAAEPPIWESIIAAPSGDIGPHFGVIGLDKADDATMGLSFGSFRFSFPFDGITYSGDDMLYISSNGFISLGGNNGTGCSDIDCSSEPWQLVQAQFPTIAPFWTDLDPGSAGGDIFFNGLQDDDDPEIDRIVITFATGFYDCENEECFVLAQVQLKEDGTVIFAYNGMTQTNSQTSDILVGLSPGNHAPDPGGIDFSDINRTDTGHEPTIYEVYRASSPPPFDLDGSNIIFDPNGFGGFTITIQSITEDNGGSVGGGGGGCTSLNKDDIDPLFPIMILYLSIIYMLRPRYSSISNNSPN